MRSKSDGTQHADLATALAHIAEGEQPDPSAAKKKNERHEQGGKTLALSGELALFDLFLVELTVGFCVGLNAGFGACEDFAAHFNHLCAGQDGCDLFADLIDEAIATQALKGEQGRDFSFHAEQFLCIAKINPCGDVVFASALFVETVNNQFAPHQHYRIAFRNTQ